jgi:aspartokinase-like uncharacterized kinase
MRRTSKGHTAKVDLIRVLLLTLHPIGLLLPILFCSSFKVITLSIGMRLKYWVRSPNLMPFYVLKLGGSLLNCAKHLMHRLHGLTTEGYSFLVTPGGGPMADLVRDIFAKQSISEEAAHWMAILAMEQYAYLLADGTGAGLTSEIKRSCGLKVLLPYQALLEDDEGICHSWNYTSDAVAAIVARRLDADMIKATDVDGIAMEEGIVSEISANALLGRRTCIDQGALHLLRGRSCWVLNGSDPDKFVSMLKKGKGGTVIRG